jgi:hypothetical protein
VGSDAEADQARRNWRTSPPDRTGSTPTGTEAGATPAASTETVPAPTGSATAAPVDQLRMLNRVRPRLWRRRGVGGTGHSNC